MKLHTFGFCCGEALQNLGRNPILAIASITTAAVSLLVFGLFLVLGQNFSNIGHTIESQVTVRVFVSAKASASQAQALRQSIAKLPHVAAVRYESKAQALTSLKKEFGSSGSLLDGLGKENPLLASYIVQAKRPKDVGAIAKSVAKLPSVDHVSYQAGVVSRLFKLIAYVRIGGLGLGVLLALGALMVIQNAIRVGLFARRREISIMRLVGATESLVKLPFILEGLTLGLVGAMVATAILIFGYGLLYQQVRQGLPFLPLLSPSTLEHQFAALLLLLGTVIGVVGSRLSLRRLGRSQ